VQHKQHILLLGGTSETAPLATKIAQSGFTVLVSTATETPLDIGSHPAIKRRCGRMDSAQITDLVNCQHLAAIVDATHPYATVVHQEARKAAQHSQRPYLRYQRQSLLNLPAGAINVADHEMAAFYACAVGKPILLTTGSRHLAPYVIAAQQKQIALFARVLNHPESIAACDQAGLEPHRRIIERGPFSVEQNRALIRQHNIGVLVTKESGNAGGIEEKIAAADLEHCQLIIVQRPNEESTGCFADMAQLVSALQWHCKLTFNEITDKER